MGVGGEVGAAAAAGAVGEVGTGKARLGWRIPRRGRLCGRGSIRKTQRCVATDFGSWYFWRWGDWLMAGIDEREDWVRCRCFLEERRILYTYNHRTTKIAPKSKGMGAEIFAVSGSFFHGCGGGVHGCGGGVVVPFFVRVLLAARPSGIPCGIPVQGYRLSLWCHHPLSQIVHSNFSFPYARARHARHRKEQTQNMTAREISTA